MDWMVHALLASGAGRADVAARQRNSTLVNKSLLVLKVRPVDFDNQRVIQSSERTGTSSDNFLTLLVGNQEPKSLP